MNSRYYIFNSIYNNITFLLKKAVTNHNKITLKILPFSKTTKKGMLRFIYLYMQIGLSLAVSP